VELLVVIGITGILAPIIVASMFQIAWGTDRNNNENVALADLDSVNSWLSRDFSQAKSTDLIDCNSGTQNSVRIDWVDESNWASENPNHYANYYIAPGTTNLLRDFDGSLGTIGRNVTGMSLCEVIASGVIQVNVTTASTGASTSTKALYFTVTPRPEAGQG